MAKECGWSHKYIEENFTVEQLVRYYEIITEQKMRELKLKTIANVQAVGYAWGSVKKAQFMKFLDNLYKKPQDIDDFIREAKLKGLPIEDK